MAPTPTHPAGGARAGPDADGSAPAGRIWIEDDVLRAGYVQCLNALLPSTVLRPPAKIVYFGVLSFAWESDAAWPSIELLAARVGLNRGTVIDALKQLKARGLLRVRRRGQGYVNLYEVPRLTPALLAALAADEPDDAEPPGEDDVVVEEDLVEARGFTPLSVLLLTARGLDAADKLTYVGLKSFAWHRSRCRLRMATLAGRIGMSERSVLTHIARLRAAGLLTRRRRGLGRSNVYTLVRPHPGILQAIQEPRYEPPEPVDNPPPELVGRCPVCRAALPAPAPALEAILTCPDCGSAEPPSTLADGQNRNPPTSRSEVGRLPSRNRKAPTSAGRPAAAPEVAALRPHEEDPCVEDPSEHDIDIHDLVDWDAGDGAAGQLWRATLVELRGLVSEAAFQTWFRGSRGVAHDDAGLTVAALHRFALEWIDTRYRAEAERALAAAAGRPLELRVVVEGAAAPAPPTRRRIRGRIVPEAAVPGDGAGVDETGRAGAVS